LVRGVSVEVNALQHPQHDACNTQRTLPMRLPLAIATLFLATTTALPAFAGTPAPISVSLRDAAATPIETVQYRTQAERQRQRTTRTYRGRNTYAAAPRVRRSYGDQGYSNPWGNCVGGLGRGADSAFPSWDTCSGR
jgi:hypothetical protein